MQGPTHLFCSAAYLAAALFAAFKMGYISVPDALLFLLASLEGVLLPDVDAPKSLATKIKLAGILKYVAAIAKTIAYITKFGLYLFLKILLWLFGKWGGRHRGIMHSFRGLLLVSAFWLGVGWLILDYFHLLKYFRELLLIIAGLLSGYLLHLWHDSLTVSGLQLTDHLKIRGWLKTGRHEWILQMYFLIISAFSAHLSNSGVPLQALAILLSAMPASFLLFGK